MEEHHLCCINEEVEDDSAFCKDEQKTSDNNICARLAAQLSFPVELPPCLQDLIIVKQNLNWSANEQLAN